MEVSEVTLKAFVESVWFKGAARGAMIGVAAAFTYVGWLAAGINGDVQSLKASVVEVREALAIRTRDNESFQADVNKDLDVIRAGLSAGAVTVVSLSKDVSDVKLDLATIKGILQEQLRRDNVASTSIPRIPAELQ